MVFAAFADPGDGSPESILMVFLAAVPFFFYHLLFELYNDGQTPGKRAMRIQVVAINGTEVTFASYLLRWLFRLIDFSLTSGVVALVSIAISDKNQRIGDLVAGTTVIRLRSTVKLDDLAYVETQEQYEVVYPSAFRLKDTEVELIQEVLSNREADNIDYIITELSTKLATKLQIEFEEHPRKFLKTLVEDYSYLNR